MNFQEGSYEPFFGVHMWLRFRRPASKNELGKVGPVVRACWWKAVPCGAEQPNAFALGVAAGTLFCEWKTSDAKPMRNPTMNPEKYI